MVHLIDSHCHLTHGKLAGRLEEVLRAAHEAGVTACVVPASDLADSRSAVEIAQRFPEAFCAAGVHPHEAREVGEDYLVRLEEIVSAAGSRNVAIGEIGLDYHYDLSPRPEQLRVFTGQLELARRLGKPVILHLREALDDMLAALAPYAGKVEGVVHSFSGDGQAIRRLLDQGWHIGFAGLVTFKNAQAVRDAALLVPAERLLVETDAPYQTPEPVRSAKPGRSGKATSAAVPKGDVPVKGVNDELPRGTPRPMSAFPNTPANVVHVARCLAEVRGVDLETLARQANANAVRLFKLDIPSE